MKNYTLFLRSNTSMSKEAFNDPAEIESRATWLKNVQENGFILNLGGTMPPIPTMATTIQADGTEVTGPFMEDSHFLTGYLIIQAKDLEAAKEIAASNPILKAGGTVEIREIILR